MGGGIILEILAWAFIGFVAVVFISMGFSIWGVIKKDREWEKKNQ